MSAFLLALREDDGLGQLLAALVILLPVVIRVGRWLLSKLGVLPPEAESARKPGSELARRRAERRAAESEGEDLWRRLARGEPPAPVVRPAEPRAREPVFEGASLEEASLEKEEEPQPLAILGDVGTAAEEPGEASETSLETEAEPVPLDALAGLPTPSAPGPTSPRRSARAFVGMGGGLRRAVVLSEVLGPPVSERTWPAA